MNGSRRTGKDVPPASRISPPRLRCRIHVQKGEPMNRHFWPLLLLLCLCTPLLAQDTGSRADLRYSISDKSAIGFINGNGQVVVPPRECSGCYVVTEFSQGYATVCVKRKVGKDVYQFSSYVIDKSGRQVSPRIDKRIGPFRNGRAALSNFEDINSSDHGDETAEKMPIGYIDYQGRLVIKGPFQKAADFSEGLAGVRVGNKFGFIDPEGVFKIEAKFDAVGRFSEGLAPAELRKNWGYIDSQGNWAIPPAYDAAAEFSEGIAAVQETVDIKYWVGIDKTGKQLFRLPNPQYYRWFYFKDGLAMLWGESKHFFIDRTGKTVTVLPPPHEYGTVSEGLIRARIGKWPKTKLVYFDTKGSIALSTEWVDGEDFRDGLAKVYKKDDCAYIDKTGAVIYAWACHIF